MKNNKLSFEKSVYSSVSKQDMLVTPAPEIFPPQLWLVTFLEFIKTYPPPLLGQILVTPD